MFGALGVAPLRVLQSIAVGVEGRAAYDGGSPAALVGLLLHFLIATVWAAIYQRASIRLRLLVERPVLCGVLYAVIVYLCVYEAVLPLSRAARDPRASLFTDAAHHYWMDRTSAIGRITDRARNQPLQPLIAPGTVHSVGDEADFIAFDACGSASATRWHGSTLPSGEPDDGRRAPLSKGRTERTRVDAASVAHSHVDDARPSPRSPPSTIATRVRTCLERRMWCEN